MVSPDLEVNLREFDKLNLTLQEKEVFIDLLHAASKERQPPLPPTSKEYYIISISTPDPSYRKYHRYFVEFQEKIIGYGIWSESFEETNTNRSFVDIYVSPQYRNQGIGTWVLSHLVQSTPDKIDTFTLFFSCQDISGFGDLAWLDKKLKSLGGKLAYTEISNGVRLDEFDASVVRKKANQLKTHATDRGYDIIFSLDAQYREYLKGKYVDFVRMREELWNDMPLEDLQEEPEILTMAEHEEMIQQLLDKKTHIFDFIAINRDSGNLAGFTEVWYSPELPWKAMQDDTGVVAAHRGNKLGLTLKYQMLEYLLSSDLTQNAKWWVTGNASANEHMIGINQELKHRPLHRWFNYEFDKNVLLENLEKTR